MGDKPRAGQVSDKAYSVFSHDPNWTSDAIDSDPIAWFVMCVRGLSCVCAVFSFVRGFLVCARFFLCVRCFSCLCVISVCMYVCMYGIMNVCMYE